MAFLINFNARTVDPNVAPEPVPTGQYAVVITESHEKAVQGNDAKAYWELHMQIINGEFKGRKVIERLNYKNDNKQTVEIAMGTLSAICYVTGVMQIQKSSQELHNKPFQIKVIKQERDDQPGQYQNRVRGYLDALGYEPGRKPEGDAANTTAGDSWGSVPQGQDTTADQSWGQADTSAADAAAKQAADKAAADQAAAAAAAAAAASQQTKALDPRVVALMGMGFDEPTATKAVQEQEAKAAAAAAAAASPAQTKSESVAAAAAAMFEGQGGGNEAVPEWAQ